MISYLQAQEIIKEKAQSFGIEEVDLDDAVERVLAENVFANRDYPPFNRSAVDGFAIRFDDFKTGLRDFEIIDSIFAGQGTEETISTGQCYKIMTGAAVPQSADAVIRREEVFEEGTTIKIKVDASNFFQNIALRGQDLQKGALALPANFKMNASAIGLLASLGKSRIKVEKKPSVAIITTGDEVIPVNEIASDFQIHNSNLHLLKALLKENGIQIQKHVHVLDKKDDLEAEIKKSLNFDVLILTGGVSAGDADYVPEILEKLGVVKLFHKVAIKPGKPIWCGQMPNKRLVFALPGNPFSCLVTFKLFVETYLLACNGLENRKLQNLPSNFNRTKKNDLDEFFPAILSGENPKLDAVFLNGSGDIRLGSFSNALAIHPAKQKEITENDAIYFMPFN